ncbi:MAG: HlyD family efflux transporter periplasmic adaptor subunit [Spirochaetaceae bacterium]|nr:HlyD family efflux transporter periplasmic adaptor subunit [Spirochaetaceae bacterium]
MSGEASDPRLRSLGLCLELERMARHVENRPALYDLMVNETARLFPYRQAAFWDASKRQVVTLSGVSKLDRDAPYVQFLEALMRHLQEHGVADASGLGAPASGASGPADPAACAVQLESGDVPEGIGGEWGRWLPSRVVWLPVHGGDRRGDRTIAGALLLARDAAFAEHEITVLSYLMDAYEHAWRAFDARRLRLPVTKKSKRWSVAILFVLFITVGFTWKVSLSSLGRAEVVPKVPWILRSPIEGVVKDILFEPNEPVEEGDVVVILDNTDLRNGLVVARQRQIVAETEYRRVSQQAIHDRRIRGELSLRRAELTLRKVEADYAAELLEKTEIRAARAGIAVYADPDDWEGRPVQTGERILSIADPRNSKLEVWLPVDDALTLSSGGRVEFFPAGSPAEPLSARLSYASYEPVQRRFDLLAYRLEARFTGEEYVPRIGLTGTAKVYSEEVSLFYYLFRRPLSALRRWMGL